MIKFLLISFLLFFINNNILCQYLSPTSIILTSEVDNVATILRFHDIQLLVLKQRFEETNKMVDAINAKLDDLSAQLAPLMRYCWEVHRSK